MKPEYFETPRLRWVVRLVPAGDGLTRETLVLQQWCERAVYTSGGKRVKGVDEGHWRDVPIATDRG